MSLSFPCMSRVRPLLPVIPFPIIFFAPVPLALGQQPEMQALVAPIAKEISHSHKLKVMVLPLRGMEETTRPLGDFLAKQISANLASAVKGLEAINPSGADLSAKANSNTGIPVYDPKDIEKLSKTSGAEIVVDGSFAPYERGLGITLTVTGRGEKRVLAMSNGKLALTPDLSAFGLELARFGPAADGIYRAGFGGVGVPQCRKCTDPSFPPEERSMGEGGMVVLDAIVGADGLVHGADLLNATNANFADAALKEVRRWTFNPAKGPDGGPVTVRIRVEIAFHFGHT